jgi:outer membrane protein OmpA-like peptidoglycan-associated protein
MTLLAALLWLAPLQDQPAGQPKFKILDIVYKVSDLGGKVSSIAVKETDTEVRIELAADVLFDFDKANILPKAEPALGQAAELILQRGKGSVRIEGHTDSKGSDSYNQKLSQRRAESVKTWLMKRQDLGNISYSASGFGAARPAVPNTRPDGSDDPEGRQKNRRVEIILSKK